MIPSPRPVAPRTPDAASAARRTIRTAPAPPKPTPAPAAPARPTWLPREASLKPALAVMGALAGFAIAYAAAHATGTGSAYELRALKRRIDEEQRRSELLVARKTELEAVPTVLRKARALGIDVDTYRTPDRVLEARP